VLHDAPLAGPLHWTFFSSARSTLGCQGTIPGGSDAQLVTWVSMSISETKRQVGLLRMLQAGVIVSDYATLMVEILKDNGRPEAGAVYGAVDMPWAKLVGQIAQAYGK
jgi:hypothetical protein